MSVVEGRPLPAVLLIDIPFEVRLVAGGEDFRPVQLALAQRLELLLLAVLGPDNILGVDHRAAAFVFADVSRRIGSGDVHPGQVQLRLQIVSRGGLHEDVKLAAVVVRELLKLKSVVMVGEPKAGRAKFSAEVIKPAGAV